MLKIRLQRIGRKNNPSYSVVVTDSKNGPKAGNFIEKVGSYDTIRKTLSLKKERILHWISVGALTSDTVHNILVRENIVESKKINVLPKKTPQIKEESGESESPNTEEVKESAETPDITDETQTETETEKDPEISKETTKAEETQAAT